VEDNENANIVLNCHCLQAVDDNENANITSHQRLFTLRIMSLPLRLFKKVISKKILFFAKEKIV